MFSSLSVRRDKEHYRLFSSGFVHANWFHLIFNMLSLYSFARSIELVFGLASFLLIYLGSILGGGLLSLLLYRDRDYRSLGASGGVCGIIFASIFLFPGGAIGAFFGMFVIPSWLYAILFLLISFFGLRNQAGNIGHSAHLGGAVIGLLITTILYPSIVLRSPILYAVVMGISVILFIYLSNAWLYGVAVARFGRVYWRDRWESDRARKRAQREELDNEVLNQLLDKISRSGMESLTASERRQLKAISKRMRESRRIH
jgi:membrane associated rhomboid family serine protease